MLSWCIRPLVAVCAVVVFLLGAAADAQPSLRALVGQTLQGRVTSVIDGDTVDVRLADGRRVRVRLEGIDAPERGEPFSVQARTAARVALFQQAVSLRATDVDQYGRLVARITASGRDSSLDLVRAGLACHFTRYSSDEALAAAQVEAHQRGTGFWAPGAQRPRACAQPLAQPLFSPRAPAPPASAVRQSLLAVTADVEYHGNRKSKVYHAPSCRNYNCPNCVVVFKSHDEAQAAGFRPAGDCLR